MSSRKKESGSSRGTSPSPSSSPLRKPNPNSSKTSRSLDSSPRTPNYLKPTASSSSSDTANKLQGRKPVPHTDSALKSTLTRRRSFDKPPSPARTIKSRGVSPTPTARSSSFSGKTGTTSPGSSKGTKQQQHHSLYATVKKSGNAVLGKKGEARAKSSASSRKQPKPEMKGVRDQEKEAEELSAGDHGELINEDTITQQLEAEIQKVDSPSFLEQDDADIAKDESPAASEQHDELAEESPVVCDEEGDHADINVKAESPKCVEGGEIDRHEEEDGSDESVAGSEEKEGKERGGGGEEEEAASEVDDGDENAAPKEAHGKKDMALSNEVIEETANKLRKQNSRVRALAGAFETVISLQEPK